MTAAMGSKSRFLRVELDRGELRRYVQEVFERELGSGVVQDVEIAWNHPDIIDIAVHLRVRKEGAWDVCARIGEELQTWGIRAGVRPEYP